MTGHLKLIVMDLDFRFIGSGSANCLLLDENVCLKEVNGLFPTIFNPIRHTYPSLWSDAVSYDAA